MTTELYKVHRPKKLDDVVGQPEAVNKLKSMQKAGRFPHTVLLSGPPGCGKTTIARIFKSLLNCGKHDFRELNCADDRGIDVVREIKRRITLQPLGGDVRIWLIDECHQLTSNAQDAFLKELEDTPEWVYFVLCTTDPQKLKKTVLSRCDKIAVKPLNAKDMEFLLKRVLKKEKKELTEEVLDKLIEHAEGSPRQALVLLNSIIDLEDEEVQLKTIERSDTQHQAIEIARALLDTRTKWSAMATIIKAVEEEAESLRWMVLSYMEKVVLGGGKMAPRAFNIITVFSEPFFNTKRTGLTAACWEIINGTR